MHYCIISYNGIKTSWKFSEDRGHTTKKSKIFYVKALKLKKMDGTMGCKYNPSLANRVLSL